MFLKLLEKDGSVFIQDTEDMVVEQITKSDFVKLKDSGVDIRDRQHQLLIDRLENNGFHGYQKKRVEHTKMGYLKVLIMVSYLLRITL